MRICRLTLEIFLALSIPSFASADTVRNPSIAPNPKSATKIHGLSKYGRPNKGRGPSLVHSEIMPAVVAFTASNVCFTYAYDHNGNRTSLTVLPYNQTGTWGSAPYGCFAWTAP